MQRMTQVLTILDRGLGGLLKTVSIICFSILFVLMVGNVFVRYFPFMSFHWFDEIVEWAFAWLVFFGSAALWRDREHFRIQWIQDKLRKRVPGRVVKIVLDLLSLLFFIILTYQGCVWVERAMDWTAFFNIPRKIIYSCIPISGCIMTVYSIRDFLVELINIREFQEQT